MGIQTFTLKRCLMNDIAKDAAKRFAQKVRDMRRAQKDYFTAPNGSETKTRMLGIAKRLEKEVDDIAREFNQTIDAL